MENHYKIPGAISTKNYQFLLSLLEQLERDNPLSSKEGQKLLKGSFFHMQAEEEVESLCSRMLFAAVESECTESVTFLTLTAFLLTFKGNTLLHASASTGNETISALLLDRGTSHKAPNKNGEIPLHRAAAHLRGKVIKQFLNQDVSIINTQDTRGNTPLHSAIHFKHVALSYLNPPEKYKIIFREFIKKQKSAVALLVDYGADINIRNNMERTPLHLASLLPHSE